MSSLKRKVTEPGLQRRVRARRESSQELEEDISEQSGNEELPSSDEEGSSNSEASGSDNEVCLCVLLLLLV